VVVNPERDRDEGAHEPDRGEDPDQRGGKGAGYQPGDDGQTPGPLPEQAQFELVAGEQEEEAEPDVGQQLDARRLGQAQGLWADEHAAGDQDDDLGEARARQQRHDQRGERGDGGHDQQRLESSGEIHTRGRPVSPIRRDHGTPQEPRCSSSNWDELPHRPAVRKLQGQAGLATARSALVGSGPAGALAEPGQCRSAVVLLVGAPWLDR